MKKPLIALLIAVCLLLGACTQGGSASQDATEPTEYSGKKTAIKEIDHCVLEPDDRARLSEKDMKAFRRLTEAMLARWDEVSIYPDTVTIDDLLDLLRESPYYYFLSATTVDGNSIRFTYAYPQKKQAEMLAFIDERMLRIANHESSPEDNELDVILKIYHAVTHEITYDKERTDNKELGSPLFIYPADEIYKALRYKKSLCYGFAYVMRFALLQRGIDCFCVFGLCTTRGDGHEWIIFRYDDQWFHCDPTWDRVTEDYTKLVQFGKTDREREVDALEMTDFASYHDPAFGKVECTDTRFELVRGMTRCTYIGGHRYYMTDLKDKEYTFDTEAFSFV